MGTNQNILQIIIIVLLSSLLLLSLNEYTYNLLYMHVGDLLLLFFKCILLCFFKVFTRAFIPISLIGNYAEPHTHTYMHSTCIIDDAFVE